LYQNYQKQGDYKNALLYLEKTNILKDSLYNENTTKTINELSVRYETEKKEQTIEALETQKTLRNYLIFLLLIGFFVAALAIWNKIRANNLEKEVLAQTAIAREQQTQKLQAEMESTQRELSMQGLYLEQRKNILQSIKQQLLGINTDVVEKKALVREIDATLQFENEWHSFRIHFDNLHPDFFRKLLSTYHNLTDLDLRHCAYIKLGMSPKQVAHILHVETDSVSMARVRLKKKMALPTGDTLQNMLQAL
jgi:hypothetical protein